VAEIKWIKITVDMFDNEKIKLIEAMPDADSILIIWVKLLTYAGRVNSSGYIMLTEKIPMNEEHLSTIFNRPLNTIRYALNIFEEFGMVEREGGTLRIRNWDVYQNVEGMDKIREQNKERQRQYRERQKRLGNSNVTSRYSNGTDIELEEDKEKSNTLSGNPTAHPYKEVIEYLNHKAGKQYRATTRKTKDLIKARVNEGFSVEDFKTVIDKKVAEWIGSDMEKYVRPETLFGTKFESYLNQSDVPTNKTNGDDYDPLADIREGG
jgi:predicted phage replisome organizer/uncharacterized phage protein (TIGR02220 family)